jgi:hypothetical protein
VVRPLAVPSFPSELVSEGGDHWRLGILIVVARPVYTPAAKVITSHTIPAIKLAISVSELQKKNPQLADWLESYAKTFELNVWNESTLKSADYDEQKKVWNIEIVKPDGSIRLVHPRHFVVSTGIGGGTPKMPTIPHAVRATFLTQGYLE